MSLSPVAHRPFVAVRRRHLPSEAGEERLGGCIPQVVAAGPFVTMMRRHARSCRCEGRRARLVFNGSMASLLVLSLVPVFV